MADAPLSAGELFSMRSTVNSYLAGTAVIQTRATSSDGQGGKLETYAAASTVSANLAPDLRGDEVEVASRLGLIATHVLTVPANTSIAADSRVVYAGKTYEVAQVKAWTPYEVHRRVLVSEVT